MARPGVYVAWRLVLYGNDETVAAREETRKL